MLLVAPRRLLARRCYGTPGQAAVGVPVGTNMTSPIATRGGAFQNSLMHRQDYTTESQGGQLEYISKTEIKKGRVESKTIKK